MLAWMVYVLVVSALLSLAALVGEKAALLSRVPTRWVWALAMLASLLLPLVLSSVSLAVPSAPAVSASPLPVQRMTASTLSPSLWLSIPASAVIAPPGLDTRLVWASRLASLTMVLVLLASAAQLVWRKRHWQLGMVAGVPVYITEGVGPAIVGLLSPSIALPRWVLDAPPETKTHVIAHEQSHLDAHDGQLLSFAVCLLVLMPWNVPVWWQLRRLRRAIEVDCDARVLRHGHDVARYGETLIAVGERQSLNIGVVASMSESKTFLEQRIRTMMRKRTKIAWLSAAVLAGVGIGLTAVAAQVNPPSYNAAAFKEVSVESKILDRYVGDYNFNGNAILVVTRAGQQLSAQLTGQPAYPIYPSSHSEFFYKIVNAQLSFTTDPQGQAVAVILHQNGQNITMPRLDETTSQQITDKIAQRVSSQTPQPGSEAALRRQIAALIDNKPDYAEVSPQLADVIRQQMPQLGPWITQLGPIQSTKFLGVGNAGQDSYDVTQKNGTTHWQIALDAKGIVTMLAVQPGP
jgi:hypothetical protein